MYDTYNSGQCASFADSAYLVQNMHGSACSTPCGYRCPMCSRIFCVGSEATISLSSSKNISMFSTCVPPHTTCTPPPVSACNLLNSAALALSSYVTPPAKKTITSWAGLPAEAPAPPREVNGKCCSDSFPFARSSMIPDSIGLCCTAGRGQKRGEGRKRVRQCQG